MADPVTPNVGLTLPTVGADSGTWGGLLNTDLTQVDSKFGGVTALALTNANVTLTSAQYGNAIISMSGALTANVTVFFPVSVGSFWQVYNACTGGFTVTLAVVGSPGTTYLSTNGGGAIGITIFSDGTNIIPANIGAVPTGTILPFCGPTAPTGFLLSLGQNVGRVPFAGLFSVIGTAFGSGDGSTTFGLPSMIGRITVGIDSTGSVLPSAYYANSNVIGSLGGTAAYALGSLNGAAENANHVHASFLSDPGHIHPYTFDNLVGTVVGQGVLAAFAVGSTSSANTGGNVTGIGLTNAFSGSGAAHQNIQPSVITNMIIKT